MILGAFVPFKATVHMISNLNKIKNIKTRLKSLKSEVSELQCDRIGRIFSVHLCVKRQHFPNSGMKEVQVHSEGTAANQE